MKRTCKELKSCSRDTLLGKYGLIFFSYFLVSLIVGVVSVPFRNSLSYYSDEIVRGNYDASLPILAIVAMIIIGLASLVLYAGITSLHLSLARHESVNVSAIFSQFRNRPDRFIVSGIILGLLEAVLVLPGTVLSIIGLSVLAITKADYGYYYLISGIIVIVIGIILGIFFFIRFSVTQYILIDNSDIGAFAAMKKSFSFTKGNAGRLLYIYFSFIPMYLLLILSLGIAGIWILPYWENTIAWYYLDISGELDRNIEEAKRMDEEMGPVLDDSTW